MTRIIDHEGRDLAARNGDGWTVAAVARQMISALEKSGRPVPNWLRLLEVEAAARLRGVETAVFGMA